MSESKDRGRHCGGSFLALEAACRAAPETTGLGWGELGPSSPCVLPPPPQAPYPLPLAQLSPLLRSRASLQLARFLVPASFLGMTLGKGLHSGPQFPTRHPVTMASHQPRYCFAVIGPACPLLLLSWAGAGKWAWGVHAVCPAAPPGGPGRRLPEPGSGTQCSRPRLEGRVGRGGQGREGKRREERGRERRGREGRGGTEWPIVCVCVFMYAHVGGPHNVPLVCLTGGGSQGSSPLGAPQGAGLAFPPQWPIPELRSLGRPRGLDRRLAGSLPPHTARHMTGQGVDAARLGYQAATAGEGRPWPSTNPGGFPHPLDFARAPRRGARWSPQRAWSGGGGGVHGAEERGRSPPPFL